MRIKIILLTILMMTLSACANLSVQENPQSSNTYKDISVSELELLLETEDVLLINVHIPLEGNIPGTDVEIPYNEVEDYLSFLPSDKSEKIVVYCRSGSMGDTASQTLVDLGYSDVSNLVGGYIAWKDNGLPFGNN